MSTITHWIVLHQAFLLFVWPTLTGVASLGYTLLDKDTRWHAAFSFLASVGIDIPKIIEALGRLVTPPPSAGSGKGGASVSKDPPKPSASLYGFGALAAAALVIAVTNAPLVGCAQLGNLPSNVPTDVTNALGCVMSALLSPSDGGRGSDLTICIAEYGPVLVADALNMILHSPSVQQHHPEVLPAAHEHLIALKTRIKTEEAP